MDKADGIGHSTSNTAHPCNEVSDAYKVEIKKIAQYS
jgi:hypothetical protein